MIDSHSHLNDPKYRDSLEKYLKRARDVGIKKFIVPGYDLVSSERAYHLSKEYDNIYAVVGVHPHDCKIYSGEVEDRLEEMARDKKVVGIGEIGLDYHYEGYDISMQKDVFIRQINLAKRISKPIVVHMRDSTKDVMDILLENSEGLSGELHCFSSSIEIALEAVEKLDFFISLAGPVTFKNASKLKEVARLIPIEKLMIETDCPYLSPEPLRGKMNEPSNLRFVLEEIARLREIDIDVLNEKLDRNTERFFRI